MASSAIAKSLLLLRHSSCFCKVFHDPTFQKLFLLHDPHPSCSCKSSSFLSAVAKSLNFLAVTAYPLSPRLLLQSPASPTANTSSVASTVAIVIFLSATSPSVVPGTPPSAATRTGCLFSQVLPGSSDPTPKREGGGLSVNICVCQCLCVAQCTFSLVVVFVFIPY